jgi:sterol 3beta-glucosyltransferase
MNRGSNRVSVERDVLTYVIAMFGLVAYPAIGLYKSMNSGKLSPTGAQILQARKMLSVYVNEQKGVREDEARRVQLIFESKANN